MPRRASQHAAEQYIDHPESQVPLEAAEQPTPAAFEGRPVMSSADSLLEAIPPEANKIQEKLTGLHVLALTARREIAADAEQYKKLDDAMSFVPASGSSVDAKKAQEIRRGISISGLEKDLALSVDKEVKNLEELAAIEIGQRDMIRSLNKKLSALEDETHAAQAEMSHGGGLFAYFKKKGAEKKLQSIEEHVSRVKREIGRIELEYSSLQNLRSDRHHRAKLAVGAAIRKKTKEVEKKYSEMLDAIPELQAMKERIADVYVLDKIKKYEPELAESAVAAALPDFHRADRETKPNHSFDSKLGQLPISSSEVKDAINLLHRYRPQNELTGKIVRFDFENQMAGLNNQDHKGKNNPVPEPEWDANHRIALDSGDVDMWQTIRKDPGFRQAFGGVLEEYDSWNRKGAIERAVRNAQFSDSNDLFLLAHFPDQESLRALTLALLGTGSSRRRAQKVFSQILNDSEWQQVLQESLQKYPEFSDAFAYLEGSPHGEMPYVKNAILRDATSYAADAYDELAKQSQVSKKPIDENRLRLALDGLTNTKLVERAVETGVFNAEDGEAVNKALDVISGEIRIDDVMMQSYVYKLRDYFIRGTIDSLSKNGQAEAEDGVEGTQLAEATGHKDNTFQGAIVPLAKEIALCKGEQNKGKLLELLNNPILRARGIVSNPELIKVVSENIARYRILEKLMSSPYDIDTFFLKPEHSAVTWVDYLADSLERHPENGKYAADFLMEVAKGSIDAEGIERCEEQFGKNISSLHVAITHMKRGLSASAIEQMPGKLPAVINADEESSQKVLNYICEQHDAFLDSDSSMQFCNRIVGLYGNQAESILKGYVECLTAGVLSKRDAPLVTEFLQHFRIVSPTIMSGYIEAKQAHQEDVYLAELNATAEGMISVKTMSESDRAKSYFKDLIKHVYPKNSANFGSHEGTEQCGDRSSDLKEFIIKPKYVIDLLSSGEIMMKEGQTINEEHMSAAVDPIFAIQRKFESVGFDPKKMIGLVERELEIEFHQIDAALPLEEKIFRAMAESLYGNVPGQSDKIKSIILGYEFASHEDVREYIAGTGDRVSQASNREYAQLCELNAFYNDRIKDVTRLLTEKAFQSEGVSELMSEYSKSLAAEKSNAVQKDKINKLQVGKLGLSGGFLSQIKRTLEQRSGRTYTDAQAKRIIRLYEKLAASSNATESPSAKKGTKAVYGQIRSQRSKTMAAIAELTGKEIQPEELSLGDIDFAELLKVERSIEAGTCNEDQFAAYTVEKAIGLFGKEQDAISAELSKFVSKTGNSRKVLNAFITKSRESACARMTGGVCVAGDNPGNNTGKNQWDSKNYFQMVFQDPESLICQGLVLLHDEERDGEKVLCASINPSSTYLYTVDEKSLYRGIASQLETFAKDNGFAEVVLSSNKAIRTNRTGGQFEAAMDESIADKNKKFTFEANRAFSYKPAYEMSAMDVIWSAA